ncbi:MAG: zinc-binding dehydrogenase [Armatimonadota bacterium]
MPVEAKAVCFPKADTAELMDITWADPGPEQLVVRMNASGISAGTEGSIFRGIRTIQGTFPLITGYQGAGVVQWAGDHLPQFRPGQRVAITSDAVRHVRLIAPELQKVWGTHASAVVADPVGVYPIPDGVPDDEASLFTVWAVGLHGVNITGVVAEDTVLVIGLGLVGLSYAQCALAAGATVVGLDLAQDRAQVLRSLGAEAFSDQEAVRGWLAERGLPGFSVVVQATQSGAVTDLAVELAAPRGKVVWQGWYPGQVSFHFTAAHSKQITMHFPCSTGGLQPHMLELIAEGGFNAGALISHHFPVERCQEAYDLAVFRPSECLGVVLEWSR